VIRRCVLGPPSCSASIDIYAHELMTQRYIITLSRYRLLPRRLIRRSVRALTSYNTHFVCVLRHGDLTKS